MNIAIIDDEVQAQDEVKACLTEYLQIHHPELIPNVRFFTFDSAETFLEGFQEGTFALLLLDIYMKGMNGMEAAREIRKRSDTCPIIFLTTSTEHLLDGYTVFAAGYLLKPLQDSRELFFEVIEHCLPLILASQQQLRILSQGIALKVPFRQILYLDCSHSHRVILHLSEQTFAAQESYSECAEILLDDQRFLECYHRIIVNMDAIVSMEEESFRLKNGVLLPISRRKRLPVTKQYMLYLAAK